MDDLARAEFLEFCDARAPSLLRVARALTADQHSAEDLLQTALERIVLRWRRVDDPEAYIRKAMYHEFVSWTRHRWWRREVLVPVLPDAANAVDATASAEHRHLLVNALKQLSPRQRAVLVLRYFEDRNDQEIADVLGCSRSTVSSQAHRALATLRGRFPELAQVREGSS